MDSTMECRLGHIRTVPAGESCLICEALFAMRKSDRDIICLQSSYQIGQTQFEFQCSRGHVFVSDSKNRACKSCKIHSIACNKHAVRDTRDLHLDAKCVYANDDSKLRFHCNKLRHNPFCKNSDCLDIITGRVVSNREFAANCKDFTRCDQDFYATPRQLKYENSIYYCKLDHYWDKNKEVIACIRIFETLYDKRFDDDTRKYGVLFTGYNNALSIAFTYTGDRLPQKCIDAAKEWCFDNAVKFVIIEGSFKRTSQLGSYIMKQLRTLGEFDDSEPEYTTCSLRKKIHTMNTEHKLFSDRCVY